RGVQFRKKRDIKFQKVIKEQRVRRSRNKMAAITSANSVFAITVPGLFNTPVQLSGYATDKAWSTDAQELAETQMGVDGRLTGGMTPSPVNQTVTLQADSPSKAIFKAIASAMKTNKS